MKLALLISILFLAGISESHAWETHSYSKDGVTTEGIISASNGSLFMLQCSTDKPAVFAINWLDVISPTKVASSLTIQFIGAMVVADTISRGTKTFFFPDNNLINLIKNGQYMELTLNGYSEIFDISGFNQELKNSTLCKNSL